MDTNELLNKYCTNLYRVGDYAFTNKEDVQKYLEAHLKCELRGYSHGVIHIPLAYAEGSHTTRVEEFIDEMDDIAEISYDNKEYGSLSEAYNDGDPTISDKDISRIEE